jgi:hypothetical protein
MSGSFHSTFQMSESTPNSLKPSFLDRALKYFSQKNPWKNQEDDEEMMRQYHPDQFFDKLRIGRQRRLWESAAEHFGQNPPWVNYFFLFKETFSLNFLLYIVTKLLKHTALSGGDTKTE